MTTNPSNDSGVETSNDSNDTTSMHNPLPHADFSTATSDVGASIVFDNSPMKKYTRGALMLYGDGVAGRRGTIVRPLHGGGSSSDDGANGSGSSDSNSGSSTTNRINILAAPPPPLYSSQGDDSSMDIGAGAVNGTSNTSSGSNFVSQPPSSTLTTRIHSIRSRYTAERAARVLSETCNVVSTLFRSSATASSATAAAAAAAAVASSTPATTSTSMSTSCPTSPESSHLGRHIELCVPISFLTTFQPSYPASTATTNTDTISTTTSTTRSPPDAANRLKAVRTSSVSTGLHRHQVPYIITMSNERKLRLAASLSNVEVLLRLLDAGVNPNSADEYKRSALHLGASRGYTDVVIQLLKYGAKPNAQDQMGNTPLHLAVCSASSFNFNRVVRILLKNGASVQVQDCHGKTPLDLVKSKLTQMRQRRANDHSPEAIKMLFDLSVLTALLVSRCMRELKSAEDMNSLEQRLQQLSTTEVECEADALLAKVEQLTLKN